MPSIWFWGGLAAIVAGLLLAAVSNHFSYLTGGDQMPMLEKVGYYATGAGAVVFFLALLVE